MTQGVTKGKNALFRLPWSSTDNPNGWIEPTTCCQLRCPGCYRGLSEKGRTREHRSVYEMQEEIDFHMNYRHAQTISIAGGEPLLYPQLDVLIRYAADRGAQTKIFTNGLLLTEERLKELKTAGATECVIHIDKYQRGNASETELLPLREKYCEMFRKIGGINLGFIQPLSLENLSDLQQLAPFYQRHSDIVHLVVFTIFKEMLPGKKLDPQLAVTMTEVCTKVKNAFGIEYCAYLGKTKGKEIAWLFSLSAYCDGKYLGSYDAHFYQQLQERYRRKKGKYFFTIRNRPVPAYRLLRFIYNRSVRKIFLSSLYKFFRPLHNQVVLIINPPEPTSDGWNLCDGCPDAMLHNNKLVPSCLLERVRSGEHIFAPKTRPACAAIDS